MNTESPVGFYDAIARTSSPEQLSAIMAEVIDNPILAAPETLRSPIVLFWQFVDEFLDSPKAFAFLFGHWVANCGLREDDALMILKSMSHPDQLAECKTKWELLNKISYRASIMLERRRKEGHRGEFNARYGFDKPMDFENANKSLLAKAAERAGAW